MNWRQAFEIQNPSVLYRLQYEEAELARKFVPPDSEVNDLDESKAERWAVAKTKKQLIGMFGNQARGIKIEAEFGDVDSSNLGHASAYIYMTLTGPRDLLELYAKKYVDEKPSEKEGESSAFLEPAQ